MVEPIGNASCRASIRAYRSIRNAVAIVASVLLAAPIASAQVVTAVEYYNASLNHYFVTVLPNEVGILDGGGLGGAWKRTGYTFDVWPGPGPGRSGICRFFSETYDTHFYARPEECDALKTDPKYTPYWTFEAVVFDLVIPEAATPSCGTGATKLYRLYNSGQGGGPNHRYTASQKVVASMHAQGWVSEGVGVDVISACLPLQTPVEPKSAAGVWTGSTSLNEPATVIVETDGTFYILIHAPGSTTETVIVYGKADVDSGQFTANATSIPVATEDETGGVARPIAVDGTYASQATLHLAMPDTAGSRVLDAGFDAGSDLPVGVAGLAGSYVGFTGHAGGRITANFAMQADGTFIGGNDACNFAGSLAPRVDVSVYDFTIRATSRTCIFGQGPISGIAFIAPGSNRLLGAAQFIGSSDLFYLVMTKQ